MNDQDDTVEQLGTESRSDATNHEASASTEGQPFRDPSHWKTGDEPITASQKSYLSTLATEAGEADEPVDSLTKAEASMRIDELREKTGRG